MNDHVTLDDRLDRFALVREVYAHVTSATPPHVVGIHGDWGSGKSSFLIQLEALLTGFSQTEGQTPPRPIGDDYKAKLKAGWTMKANYPVIWFEAWKYQNDPQPIVSLLREIRTQLSPARKSFNWLKKEVAVSMETALASIDALSKYVGFRINPKEIRERGERYEAERHETPTFTSTVDELLGQAIKQVLDHYTRNTKADRVVVLIDDLDRCEPAAARAILEGLRVFLQLKNVLFVIAMDETVVEEFIAKDFVDCEPSISAGDGGEAGAAKVHRARRRARQYLEKLCHGFYRLPFSVDPKPLFIDLLREHGAAEPSILALERAWAPPTLDVVPRNPRKIKLLVETTSRILKRAGSPTESQAALAYLLAFSYQFEPDLYRLIERYKSAVFGEWLLRLPVQGDQAVGDAPQGQAVPVGLKGRLTLPRGLSDYSQDPFPDPIRAGVFYPASLLSIIGSPTDPELDVLLI